MLELFSLIAVKSIKIGCMVFLLGSNNIAGTLVKAVTAPVRYAIAQQQAEEDSLATKQKEAEDKQDEEIDIKKYKSEKKKEEEEKVRNLKISISDKGVKLDSGEGDEILLDIDKDRISGDLEKVFEEIDGIEIDLDDMEGYGDVDFLNIEDRDFKVIRSKDIVLFGEEVRIGRNELVRGDVVVFFGSVEIDGKVTGDVVSILGDIEIGPSAIVNGEVVSVLGALDKDPDARVRGETVEVWGKHSTVSVPFLAFGGGVFRAISKIIAFIVGAFLLLIILYFLPDRIRRSSEYIFGSFFKSLGVGILVLFVGGIVVGLVGAILSITIIGIPVAILLALSFAALILVGYFVSALALGRFVVKKFNIENDSIFVHGIIGLFGLSLLGILSSMMWFAPYFLPARVILKSMGAFLNFLALFTGVGAFVLSKMGQLSFGARPSLPEPEMET